VIVTLQGKRRARPPKGGTINRAPTHWRYPKGHTVNRVDEADWYRRSYFFLPTQLELCFLPVDLLRVVALADLQADLGDR